jgi:hypothetical protein
MVVRRVPPCDALILKVGGTVNTGKGLSVVSSILVVAEPAITRLPLFVRTLLTLHCVPINVMSTTRLHASSSVCGKRLTMSPLTGTVSGEFGIKNM